ncbi:MAG: LamG domain-containing protein [Saprospiraceae bacterium]|nr:LamG domain-containing protein [Saprospiraceae bacterium]
MKKGTFIFSAVVLVFFSCKDEDLPISFESECYPPNLEEGVIASYDFSNGSLENGTSINADLRGYSGAFPTSDRNGNVNCAYSFSKNPQLSYLATSNTSFLNGLKQFSISMWYQPQDSFLNGGQMEVLMTRNRTQDVQCPDRIGEWSVGLYDCRRVVFGHNNSVWEDIALPPPPAECQQLFFYLTGLWHHVVAVYNEDHYKIYKDGILQDSTSGPGACTDLHLAEDVGDLVLGYKFTGKLDDILIYNREITSEEVAELFALQPCCQQ